METPEQQATMWRCRLVMSHTRGRGAAILIMFELAWQANEEWKCIMEDAALCKETRIKSLRTVRKHVRRLVEAGEIETWPVEPGCNGYRILAAEMLTRGPRPGINDWQRGPQ